MKRFIIAMCVGFLFGVLFDIVIKVMIDFDFLEETLIVKVWIMPGMLIVEALDRLGLLRTTEEDFFALVIIRAIQANFYSFLFWPMALAISFGLVERFIFRISRCQLPKSS